MGGRHRRRLRRSMPSARRAPTHPAMRAATRFDLNDTSSEDEPDGALYGMAAAAAAAKTSAETLAAPEVEVAQLEAVVHAAEATPAPMAEASEPAAVPMALYSPLETDALRRIRNACANIILRLA